MRAPWRRCLMQRGYKIVSGGTDNHLFLVDLIDKDITGKEADAALGRADITVNKNCRAQRPAVAVRHQRHPHRHPGGHHARLQGAEVRELGRLDLRRARRPRNDERSSRGSSAQVLELCARFPVYGR